MDVKVVWSKSQLEAAAKFISENNPAFKGQLKEIRSKMVTTIVRLAENFPSQVGEGTMGFYIEAMHDEEEGLDGDENIITIQIWVDPGVGHDTFLDEDSVEKTFYVDTSRRK